MGRGALIDSTRLLAVTYINSMADSFKIDRSAFSIISTDEQLDDEKTFWLQKTPHERLEAVELTRRILYGYNPTTLRLQRVFEVIERA